MNDHPTTNAGDLQEVIQAVVRRRISGEVLTDEAVLAEFPELADQLVGELPKLRLIHNAAIRADALPASETITAWHSSTPHTPGHMRIRCPFCRESFETPPDTAFTDITCQSCGSSFNLASSDDDTRSASALETVGHFDLVERIGMGGFGTVWKGRDTKLDRTVAIKLPRQGVLEPAEVEKFFREARAAAQLKHPNIVAVHEVGRQGDTLYIVSDYVRGITLSDWLTGQRPTAREAAALCIKIAEALHHAHEQGVIHRDLKPHNIMIDGDGEPHLMDFGLARREAGETTMTLDGQVLGTPAYMSPEQARGEGHGADRRSDVYSLGVILFQLLTNEIPFRGNARMLMHQVIHDEPPSPRKLIGSIPKDLETITLKCLEKIPNRRYATAAEVADEFRRFLSGEPILARPIRPIARAWRWCERRPLPAGFIVLISVLTVAGPIVAVKQTVLHQRAEVQRIRADENEMLAQERAAESEQALAEARANLGLANLTTYDLTLASASRIAGNDPPQALAMIENEEHCPAELRDLSWSFFHSVLRQYDQCIPAHKHGVRGLDISPNAQFLVTCGEDGTAKIWEAKGGTLVHELSNHPGNEKQTIVFGAAFSRTGKTVTTYCQRAVCTWNVQTGRKTHEFSVHDYGRPDGDLAYSARRDRYISVASNQLNLWTANSLLTGKPAKQLLLKGIVMTGVAWSPDGRTVATADQGENTITLWDSDDLTVIRKLEGHTSWAVGVAFSSDNRLVASAGWDGTARIWDAATGELVRTLATPHEYVITVAFSPDGRLLATGGNDGSVCIWLVKQGILQGQLFGHRDSVSRLLFVGHGHVLVSAGKDGTVRTWRVDLESKEGTLVSLNFTAPTLPMLSTNPPSVRRMWSHDARLRGVTTWFAPSSPPTTFAFARNCEILVVGCENGTAELYDLHERRLVRRLGGEGLSISRIALSNDRRVCAAIVGDHTLRVWGATEAMPTLEMRVPVDANRLEHFLFDVAVSPDGRHIAVAGDANLTLIDAQSGNVIASRYGHTNQVKAVAYSPDARFLATGSRDCLIGLWDTSSYELLNLLDGHTSEVTDVTFSADGSTLVTAGTDRTVRLWDVGNGKLRHTLHGHANHVKQAVMTTDGKTVVSLDAQGTMMFWDSRLGISRGEFSLGAGSEQLIHGMGLSETAPIWMAALAGREILLWELTATKAKSDGSSALKSHFRISGDKSVSD